MSAMEALMLDARNFSLTLISRSLFIPCLQSVRVYICSFTFQKGWCRNTYAVYILTWSTLTMNMSPESDPIYLLNDRWVRRFKYLFTVRQPFPAVTVQSVFASFFVQLIIIASRYIKLHQPTSCFFWLRWLLRVFLLVQNQMTPIVMMIVGWIMDTCGKRWRTLHKRTH